MSSFTQPSAPGSGIKWDDHKGALLVIEPKSFEPDINTAYGVADAIKADVYVIDGPGVGAAYDDTLVFPKVLLSQLKSSIGGKVLGRLGQGQGKPGQSAPWRLEAATDTDMQAAEKWLENLNKSSFVTAEPPF